MKIDGIAAGLGRAAGWGGLAALLVISGLGPVAADGMARQAGPALPPAGVVGTGSVALSVDVGWSELKLPEVHLGSVQDIPSRRTLLQIENAESQLQGYSIGLGVHTAPNPAAMGAMLGVKGFYSDYDKRSRTAICTGSQPLQIICEMVPIFDPNPNTFELTTNTFASNVTYLATRDAQNWGVALEAIFPGPGGASGLLPKVGLGYKRLSDHVHMNINATFGGSVTLASYNQKFDTDYWGAYFGFVGKHAIVPTLNLTVDVEAGIYLADASYAGRYASNQGQFVGPAFTQTASMSDSDTAVIVKGRAELEKTFGNVALAAFIQGEFYSYAPKIQYNDTDRGPIGRIGNRNDGSSIIKGAASTVTAGGRVRVKF